MLKNKMTFGFVLTFFLFLTFLLPAFPKNEVSALELPTPTPIPGYPVMKYTAKERVGAGFDGHCPTNPNVHRIHEFNWEQLGLGWWFDWGFDAATEEPQMDYLGLVGGWYGDPESTWPSSVWTQAKCNMLKTRIAQNPSKYPDGMNWTVGNEIGWDDKSKDVHFTSSEYVEDFKKWRTCLKEANPTFKVGTGAIISPYHRLPKTGSACIGDGVNPANFNPDIWNDTNYKSGGTYFKEVINGLQSAQITPDFVTVHGYNHCQETPSAWNSSQFIKNMRVYRRIMKDKNWRNVDMVVNEFSGGGGVGATNPTITLRLNNYVKESVEYAMTATDAEIGNPTDGNRLVQRFAWYVGNSWKNKLLDSKGNPYCKTNEPLTPVPQDPNDELFNTYTTQIKVLGTEFKNKVTSVTNSQSCTIQLFTSYYLNPTGVRARIKSVQNDSVNQTYNLLPLPYGVYNLVVSGGQYYSLTLEPITPDKATLVSTLVTNSQTSNTINTPGGPTYIQLATRPTAADLVITNGVNKRIDVFCPLPAGAGLASLTSLQVGTAN